jgi:hypothetical protein
MRGARSVLLAVLVVAASVVGSVGVMGQTATDTGPVQYEFDGSPETLVVDTSALDGGTEFTVEYATQGGPSTGTTVLARETYNTANLKGDELWFYSEGAYESVNVTVSDYSGGEPAFESRGIADSLNLKKTVVGSTGGDSDLTCDLSERLGTMTGGYEYLDCTAQPGTTTVNTTGLDAADTEIEVYQSALNQKASAENYQTTLDNYLSDTKTQARIIGKNAYIKALNNGSSKSAAKSKAKTAVSDYYAVKQVQLRNEWDRSVSHGSYMQSVLASQTGTQARFASEAYNLTRTVNGPTGNYNNDPGDYTHVTGWGSSTTQLSLVNGSTATSDVLTLTATDADNGASDQTVTQKLTNAGGNIDLGGSTYQVDGIKIKSTADKSAFNYMDFERFRTQWAEIESQNTQVQNNMDTLAENTYSAYQQGEINNTDLVDPYVLANQQSAGSDFQGWTAAQLTLLGTNSPENFDQIGSFNVTTGSGTQYEGVLFSQENPTSGQFANGTTYDTANIGGTQYVVTSDQIVELSGTFTIDRITTTSGETTENVTIQKTTYETTNVTELKQQYEDLAYKRAQIEAREKALKQSAGGGLLGGGSVPPVVALAVIGTLLGIVVLQN